MRRQTNDQTNNIAETITSIFDKIELGETIDSKQTKGKECCWLWTQTLKDKKLANDDEVEGIPVGKVNGEVVQIHTFLYDFFRGRDNDSEEQVRMQRICGFGKCVNPAHWYAGSTANIFKLNPYVNEDKRWEMKDTNIFTVAIHPAKILEYYQANATAFTSIKEAFAYVFKDDLAITLADMYSRCDETSRKLMAAQEARKKATKNPSSSQSTRSSQVNSEDCWTEEERALKAVWIKALEAANTSPAEIKRMLADIDYCDAQTPSFRGWNYTRAKWHRIREEERNLRDLFFAGEITKEEGIQELLRLKHLPHVKHIPFVTLFD